MIIAIGHTKGGVGKSTLATNLAGIAARRGISSVLADLDIKQTSSKLWHDQRQLRLEERPDLPDVACFQLSGKTSKGLIDLEKHFDLVVADVGGFDSSALRGALLVADMLVIPSDISAFSLWAQDQITEIVDSANELRENNEQPPVPIRIVLNMVSTNPNTIQLRDAREYLGEDARVLDAFVRFRESFKRAAAQGLTVLEYRPRDASAIGEMTRVYKEILHDLGVD